MYQILLVSGGIFLPTFSVTCSAFFERRYRVYANTVPRKFGKVVSSFSVSIRYTCSISARWARGTDDLFAHSRKGQKRGAGTHGAHCGYLAERKRSKRMSFPGQRGRHVVEDASVSELVEQWVGEQLQHEHAPVRSRPRIGRVGSLGTLRDGGWSVYGADALTAHDILQAGGFPCPLPPLPLLEGYATFRLLFVDYSFALRF